jgi:hypothetical protein
MIVFLSGLMAVSVLPLAEGKLWEFVIISNVNNKSIVSGDTVVISGQVVDHAYNSIRGAEVILRTGSDSVKVFTDPWGQFKAEFKDMERPAGTYPVNIVATWYEMKGLSSTSFDVKGEASKLSLLEQQLTSEQARKYLSAKEGDFEKDPIGQMLFNYYHGLLDELILEKKEELKPNEKQIRLDEQRKIAEELKRQAIDFHQPGAGTYGGYQYEDYITGLRPEIKELFINQLNFTKNTFENAQNLRAEILENGGTFEEAQKAYLEMIAIPKEILEQFNQEKLDAEAQSED